MRDTINKPIFLVGSPRSGTSILTWCVGQHPNIFPLDESTGIGELALALAVCYQTKMGLGPDSLWSAMNMQREEFLASFGQTLNELIQRGKVDLERKRWEEVFSPNTPPHAFPVAKATYATKTRWVDGTPAYSFHICGLLKLFPNALFIHIVRDVTSVVRSMLNFHRLAGVSLVDNEQHAYNLWFHSVSACLLAEQAYGPHVVFRLKYSELVNQPEASLRALLGFLSEPYAPECLGPLQKKINSSDVPNDFRLGDKGTDPLVIERATQLNAEIETNPQVSEVSTTALDKMEATFNDQISHRASIRDKYTREHARAKRLANEIKLKEDTIRSLRSRRWRHKLRQLVFGQDAVP
jgi:sulfotransferase family protein